MNEFSAARLLPLALSLFLPFTALAQEAGQAAGTGQGALAQCLEVAGAPDDTLPVSPDKLADLRAAAEACDRAMADGSAGAEVYFLMGMLQQSEGAIALAMEYFRQAAWMALENRAEPMPAPGPKPAQVPAGTAQAPADTAEGPAGNMDAVSAMATALPGAGSQAAPERPEPPEMAEADADDTPAASETAAAQAAMAPRPEPGASLQATATASQEEGLPAADASAAQRCAALAGPPDSGVPVSPKALEAALAALRLAQPDCEAAIADGSADAATYFQLAVLAQNQGDHTRALEYFAKSAEMGLSAAHSKLGDYFLFGIGPVKADVDKAVAHYRLASDAGDLASTTTLAFLYRLGRGVPRDPARMLQLMQKAADGGYQFAQYRLAQTYLTGDGIAGGADPALGVPDPELGARYLEMAARQGNPKAILELAALYIDDGRGVAANPEAYAYWTQQAAETGDPAATAALGLLYEQGTGVESDPERAAALYVEALESGKLRFADLRRLPDGRVPGWDRPTALAFQRILQARGFYQGALDGIVGPMTRAAAARLAP